MDLSGLFSSYDEKVDTVIEYWRNIDKVNANLTDDEILQIFLCFSVEQEFNRILDLKGVSQ